MREEAPLSSFSLGMNSDQMQSSEQESNNNDSRKLQAKKDTAANYNTRGSSSGAYGLAPHPEGV